jgi:large subunit ribosomal protein L15
MKLNQIADKPGARKNRLRIGRGIGSGMGKTGGRGGKGQTARSGSSIRIGFEGGQMPLIRRIPKRGFNNARFTVRYSPVNVGDLEKFDNGARVDETALRAVGLANGKSAGIKILGNGELSKKLSVSASAFSASAKAKIEAKGGTVQIVGRKPAAPAKV